jgi:hypothetical protein
MRHYIGDVHEMIKLQKKQSNIWTILKRVMSQITWLKPIWNVIIQPADAIIESTYESGCIQAIAWCATITLIQSQVWCCCKLTYMMKPLIFESHPKRRWKIQMVDPCQLFEAASLSSGVTASAALALSMRKVQCWSPVPTFSAFPLWGAWHTAWCLSHDPNTRITMNEHLWCRSLITVTDCREHLTNVATCHWTRAPQFGLFLGGYI